MAGLLAGAMLRSEAQIYEAAPELPNNHHALLRFRSDDIAQYLNIEFQPVEVIKIVKPWRNKVAEAVGYSLKSNGRASVRSIKSAEGKVDKRFIAPPDFIQQLEELQSNEIAYDSPVDLDSIEHLRCRGPIISTIPMGSLMKLLEYPGPRLEFGYRHGWVVKGHVNVPSDLCSTIYYPDPAVPIIRATLTGDLIQVEMVSEFDRAAWAVDRVMDLVLQDFGLEGYGYSAEMVPQRYAKITPIPERDRLRFILWATDNYSIYSLGRFATWRPGLLMDDCFHDVRKIQHMIRRGNNYEGRLR
jgi:hypothetical protein